MDRDKYYLTMYCPSTFCLSKRTIQWSNTREVTLSSQGCIQIQFNKLVHYNHLKCKQYVVLIVPRLLNTGFLNFENNESQTSLHLRAA